MPLAIKSSNILRLFLKFQYLALDSPVERISIGGPSEPKQLCCILLDNVRQYNSQ